MCGLFGVHVGQFRAAPANEPVYPEIGRRALSMLVLIGVATFVPFATVVVDAFLISGFRFAMTRSRAGKFLTRDAI